VSPPVTPQAQLQSFLDKYDPAVAELGVAVLEKLRPFAPGATEMVYDNYNFLVVGFAPGDRPSEAVFSLAFTPRWVSLCFLQDGADLPDPDGLLEGAGKVARHIKLHDPATVDAPAVQALLKIAVERARVGFDPSASRRLVIRSVSKKQRPRRP